MTIGDGLSERQRLLNDSITLHRAAGVYRRRAKDGFWTKLIIRLLEGGSQRMRVAAEEGRPWPR